VLLADEPTGNLDTRTGDAVMNLFKELNDEGMTIVMVTHSPRYATHMDRILTIADGRLVADDSAGEGPDVRPRPGFAELAEPLLI
jgi:putative ABC transport system ATP-binding protein